MEVCWGGRMTSATPLQTPKVFVMRVPPSPVVVCRREVTEPPAQWRA